MHFFRKHTQAGLSLIIVAVLLVAIGSAVGVVLMRKDRETAWTPKTGAHTDLQRVKEALVAYQRQHHRLPCVAPRDNSAPAGIELADCSVGGSANLHGTIRADIGGGVIMRVGAVPTVTLSLPASAGEDRWGNRLLYAMSEQLSDPYQFTHGSGTLQVDDISGTMKTDVAAFVVLTHGRDGKGAYTGKGGVMGRACNATEGKDQENCDNDKQFIDTAHESTTGAEFYDDLVAWDRVDALAQTINKPCTVGDTGAANWGSGCTNNSWINMLHGASGQPVTNDNTGTHTGSATLACENGVLLYSDEICHRHCLASTQSWDGGNCQGSVPLVVHSGTSGTITNTNAGYDGNATFSCNDGTLSETSSSCTPSVTPPSCAVPDCDSSTLAPGGCLSHEVWRENGTYRETCCNGVLTTGADEGPGSVGVADCSPPSGCAAAPRTWTVAGKTCSATVPATASGANGTAQDLMPMNVGTAQFACSGTTLAATPNAGATCGMDCGSGCSFTNPRTGVSSCMSNETSISFGDGICQQHTCCGGTMHIEPLAPCPLTDSMDTSVSCSGLCLASQCQFTDNMNCYTTCHNNASYKIDNFASGKPRYQCSGGSMVFINNTDASYLPPPSCP